jgi:hypothetical protein
MFTDWSSGSGFAEEKNVRGDEREYARRNEKNMRYEKPRDGESTHLRAATH